jgi:hypothetical protein
MIAGNAYAMVASVEGFDDVTQQVTQQAARKRNPFYVNRRAMQTIRFLVNGLTSAVDSVRMGAEKAIADELLVSIGENVEGQRNPDGRGFTPLTAAYARRKQRKFGFTIPILKATGDLLGGLRTRVNRHRA